MFVASAGTRRLPSQRCLVSRSPHAITLLVKHGKRTFLVLMRISMRNESPAVAKIK